MARKHNNVIKNVHCIHKTCFATFYDFGVYLITEKFPFFFFSSSRQIGKLQQTLEKLLRSLVQKNMRVFLHFIA